MRIWLETSSFSHQTSNIGLHTYDNQISSISSFWSFFYKIKLVTTEIYNLKRGRRGRDRMVDGFITTYAIRAYHHYCEFESRSVEMYSIQHCVIKFVIDWRQVGGFQPGTPVSSTNKTDHDINEILLKVALNTITHRPYNHKTVINSF